MTTRPTARNKSVLAGQSPIGPSSPKQPLRKRGSWWPDEETFDRMQSVWVHVHEREEDMETWSDMVNRAHREFVERMEAKYNGGERFPEVPPGAIPRGRPKGR